MGQYETEATLLRLLTDEERRLAKLERMMLRRNVGSDGKWHHVGDPGEPAFEANWSNHLQTAFSGPVRFMKDGDGFVHIAGTAIASAGADFPVFTLPEGFRPQWTIKSASTFVPSAGGLQVGTIQIRGITIGTQIGRVEIGSGAPASNDKYLLEIVPFYAGG